nr:SdrD B-like domain-containing protein [Sandaracinobacteroides sayramensis]
MGATAPAFASDVQVSDYGWQPDPVPNGATTQFSIRLTNNGPTAVSGAVVTVSVPSRFQVSAGDFPSSCTLAGAAGAQTLSCTIEQFPVGNQMLDYKATAVSTGASSSTASIALTSGTDPNPSNNSLTVSPAVVSGADLSVTKTDNLLGSSIVAGGLISYTLSPRNDGPNATAAIRVIDNLPPASDFQFQSASGSNWNCQRSGTVVTCTWQGASIQGALPPITITGRVIRQSSGTITNNAFTELTSPSVLDPHIGNNAATPVVTLINEGSDLRAGKSFDDTTIVAGNSTIVTLTIYNDGPLSVNGASISDSFAGNFEIGTLPAGCARSGQTVTCSAGNLASGTSRQFQIPVTALTPTAGTQQNVAVVTAPSGLSEPDTENNRATASYRIVPASADLFVTKTKTPNPVQAGELMTSHIRVHNDGPSRLDYSPANPLVVTDTVSADESYVSASAGWACSQDAAIITCRTTGTGSVAVNGRIDLDLVTRAGATANVNLTNTACSGSTANSLALPADGNSGNDCAGATARSTTVTTDLSVLKQVGLSPAGPWTQTPALTVPAGSQHLYIRFVASNLGTETAETVVVRDTLPNRLNGGGFQTPVAQESATAGAVSYTAGNGELVWTFGNLEPGGSREAVVRMTRPFAEGAYTNTARISSPDTIDSDSGNNQSSALYDVVPLADMAVTGKTITPNPARVGTLSHYTINVRNEGGNTAQNVVVTDSIDPARFELVGNPTTTKPGGVCTADPATGLVSCQMADFTRGQTFQIQQQVRPRFPFGGATSGFPIRHTNTASVTTTTAETTTANNAGSVEHDVNAPGFDLAITKQEPSPEYDPRRFGDELVYDLRVSNYGPSRATNLTIIDTPEPPAGYGMAFAGFEVNPVPANGNMTLYTPPAPNCALNGGKVECRLHASQTAQNFLDAERQVIFRLRFTTSGTAPTGPLTFSNRAEVVALEQDNTSISQADAQLDNNKAVQTTTVLPSVDLEVVSKSVVGPNPASVNEPIQYRIVVRNNGVSPIAQVRVTDNLPAGFVLAAPTPTATASGAASVSSIACTGSSSLLCVLDGSFPPDGSQVTILLSARAAHPFAGALNADQTNTASIAPGKDAEGQDLARDADDSNNSKTAAVRIVASSIAGTVFADNNLDGAMQAGEAIAGVGISLSGTDSFGNAITATATTDASGNYRFDRLPPGTYTLVETQPAGFHDWREVAGSSGGTVNNGAFTSAPAENSISAIALAAQTDATGYIFQELAAGSIAGTVYRDSNNNGALDAGETGVGPGEFPSAPHLRLSGTDYAGNAVNLTRSVNATGGYLFDDLAPSDAQGYRVTQLVQPNGLSDGLDRNGIGAVIAGSAGRTAPEDIVVGPLAPGQALTNRDFGELPSSSLSGTVFLDPNSNATRDADETTGLAGALVRLTGTNDLGQTVDCQLTTTATGQYSFPLEGDSNPDCRVLRPGTYAVSQTPPAGLTPSGAFIGSAGGTSGGVSGSNVAAPGVANTSVSNVVIASGTSATRYDFGATGQGLGGYVYVDRNDNGVRDAGEPGIAGVSITLSGETANGQDVCAITACTATTDASGAFLFNQVPGSSTAGYTLTEQAQSSAPLSAYADGADAAGTVNGVVRGTAGNDVISGIVIGTGELGVNYAFGERAGSLSGSSYIDGNDDGIRQPGEAGLPGVTVTLSGRTATGEDICALRAALDPALSCTATTDANGNYRFDDLPAGSYDLVQDQPSAYADGRESAGTPGGSVNNGSFGPGAATNGITAIPLGNGADGSGYDFGERATSLSGRVYLDRDRDGVDDNESGIAGVTITLMQNGAVVATTTTGADGSYRFDNLPAGSYTVVETQPAGYGSSTPDSRSVAVTAGESAQIDFGETLSTLSGSVFVDSSNDGVRQTGERGIEGVSIRLTGTDAAGNPVERTATTDANGDFRFEDLLSGSYTLSETQPSAYSDGLDSAGTAGGTVGNDVVSGIALGAGIDAGQYGFGERGQAQGGTVYVDLDNNGVQDPGEPGIPGVTVELQRPDGTVVQSVTTGPDGRYDFAEIEAGDYVIVEKQPAGYGEGPENPGNRVPLKVGVDQPVTPVNFGERVGSIAGRVYNDTNGNGAFDPREPGIPGVMLTLSGTDARGNPVSQTVVTAADGSYRFTALVGGSYSIRETQPAGYRTHSNSAGTSGGIVSGDVISAIELGGGIDSSGYLFGEQGDGARISGHVWLDSNHDRALGAGEALQGEWIVELLLNGEVVETTTTGADGGYAFEGVAPGSGYGVRFRNPVNNAAFGSARPNETGAAAVNGEVSPANPAGATMEGGTLSAMTVQPGADIRQQSLPLDPSGVVYDAVRRTPVEGATVRIGGPAGFDPAVHLLGGAANASQVTGSSGIYQFLLLPGAPAGTYTLAVTPPNGSYNPLQPSAMIPPCGGAYSVQREPDPLLMSTYNSAPPTSAAAACNPGGQTTAYYLAFALVPGVSANIVNNHIPLDPVVEGAIEVTKRTPMTNVSRGQLVPYTITARNTLSGAIGNIAITDVTPAGFRYREGSATVDGVPTEPVVSGRTLSWPNQSFTAGQEKTVQLILTVGAGVGEGEHVNRAHAVNTLVGGIVSNIADATVRIIPDPDFDCSDVIGKVFDDRNMNGVQDKGEPGLPGVRVASARGLLITTDSEGRYHVTCPMIPNEDRGSNFILKLDERTLPTGYRMISVNPDTVRLTRGKMVTMNFAAALGRVVRLDVNGDAFAGEKLADAFLPRLDALVATLAEKPSVLRLSYGVRGEEKRLVKARLEAVKDAIRDRWRSEPDRYRLIIEEETSIPAKPKKGDAQ